jgi:hypothetical protein
MSNRGESDNSIDLIGKTKEKIFLRRCCINDKTPSPLTGEGVETTLSHFPAFPARGGGRSLFFSGELSSSVILRLKAIYATTPIFNYSATPTFFASFCINHLSFLRRYGGP